ncbi:MAG: hypothetical protein IKW99_03680 [Bacteroidales bacterium]|nr:hypothetical protein [Bacteroidales bacterium]
MTKKPNFFLEDYANVRKAIANNKTLVLGYIAWFIINCTLWIFGGSHKLVVEHGTRTISPKRAFFPFNGSAKNYDFSEFFVYVIAIPILAFIAFLFLKNKKFKLPKISFKTILYSLPLAFCFSLFTYAVAMKPVEHYVVKSFNVQDKNGKPTSIMNYTYFMDVSKAEISTFLGDTYRYNPYKSINTYFDYPLRSSFGHKVSQYPKMPLLFRLRVALMILLSWKGLRFFIIMWLLSYGILGYSIPKIRSVLFKEANDGA